MDADAIRAMTVEMLKEKLREHNLSVTGRKRDLQVRLLQQVVLGVEHDEEEIESENESANSLYEDAATRSSNPRRVLFTLRDIEDSVSHFFGNGTYNVCHWVEEFDEISDTVGWNNLQRFVYAKQLLKAAAKLFVRSLVGVRDWDSLKRALIDEFGEKLCDSEVHRALRNRNKLPKESLHEYLYTLLEMGKQISLDEKSKIEYFVEGIPDGRANKSVLYQAKSIRELKVQIRVYEKIKGSQISTNRVGASQAFSNKSSDDKGQNKKKCFKCNKEGHLARECPSGGSSNVSCFKCKQKGHYAHECKEQKEKVVKSERVNTLGNSTAKSVTRNGMIFVDATVKNLTFSALVDTGCSACIMRYDTLIMLGDVELSDERQRLFGIGKGELTTLGSFRANMVVDELPINVTFHVVRERDIPYAAMIGNDVLKEVELVFREGTVEFKKPIRVVKENVVVGMTTTAGHGSCGGAEVVVSVHDERACGGAEAVVSAHDELGDNIVDQTVLWEHKDETKGTSWLETKVGRVKLETGIAGSNKTGVDNCFLKEFEVLCAIENEVDKEADKVEISHLGECESKAVMRLINEYCPKKPASTPVQMKLILTDEKPVYQRPRRVSYADQRYIDEQVENMLREGIIQNSTSEYASPVVLTKKKNGTRRFCCDFRKINEKIIRDNFPMTLMDEVLDKLQGVNTFTTLDLKIGFYHAQVEPESRKYTSFETQSGQCEFCFVPFGITNSPAVFCRYIRAIFQDMLADGTVVIYMDDIVIPAKDEEVGRKKLEKVLKRASDCGLHIRWEKCQILKKQIHFLGYIVENGNIRPSVEKTRAISNFPIPVTRKELQQFLGLTSFFRRFVQKYAVVAKPLSDLLRKDEVFKIGEEQLLAIQELKGALVSAPVLKLFNPLAETEVHADASKFGYVAVLLQRDSEDQMLHPVEFMSRKTSLVEEKYSAFELEVLAVIKAIKKWRIYLKDIKFKIVSDCNAFAMTVKKQDVPDRIMRWAMYLQEYDYVVEHRSGTRMRHVDALSRVYCLLVDDSLKFRLRDAQMQDDWIRAVRQILESGGYENFFLKNELVYKDPIKELLVVPSSMEDEIIRLAHIQGHFAAKRTLELVEKNYYIPNANEKVRKVVQACVECIVIDANRGKK